MSANSTSEPLKIALLIGTSRQGNYTQYIANFVEQFLANQPNIEVKVISSSNTTISFADEGPQAAPTDLVEKLNWADAFYIVSPEYNHGYPATLKYLLDLNLKAYRHKAVTVVGVSDGPFGGVRMIESLLSVLRTLGLHSCRSDVAISNVAEEVQNGVLVDINKWQRRLEKQFVELKWLATTLRYGRQNIPQETVDKS